MEEMTCVLSGFFCYVIFTFSHHDIYQEFLLPSVMQVLYLQHVKNLQEEHQKHGDSIANNCILHFLIRGTIASALGVLSLEAPEQRQ